MVNRQTYREQSRVFLEQASIELANGDLYQASEKGWGAAAQIVKAVASQRGWEHNIHSDLFNVVDRLVKETGNNEPNLALRISYIRISTRGRVPMTPSSTIFFIRLGL